MDWIVNLTFWVKFYMPRKFDILACNILFFWYCCITCFQLAIFFSLNASRGRSSIIKCREKIPAHLISKSCRTDMAFCYYTYEFQVTEHIPCGLRWHSAIIFRPLFMNMWEIRIRVSSNRVSLLELRKWLKLWFHCLENYEKNVCMKLI